MQECLEQNSFHPHPALWNGHLQTIVAAQQRRSFEWGWKDCVTRKITLKDRAVIRVEIALCHEKAPTLVAVHGMGGSSDSMYMLGLSHKAFLQGWNSVRLSLYNRNHELKRPRIFHAGCSGALAEITAELTGSFGLREILLVGVSMGGNILLKLLGEWGSEAPREMVAAATISPLVDLTSSWRILESSSNRLYRWYYVNRLRRLALARADLLNSYIDVERLRKVKSIREFDEAFTVPLSGYRDVHEYYARASAVSGFEKIGVPALIIHSRDDPLLPWRPLVSAAVEQNPCLHLVLCNRGGHAAFIEAERRNIDRSWAENRVIDFFRLAVSLAGRPSSSVNSVDE